MQKLLISALLIAIATSAILNSYSHPFDYIQDQTFYAHGYQVRSTIISCVGGTLALTLKRVSAGALSGNMVCTGSKYGASIPFKIEEEQPLARSVRITMGRYAYMSSRIVTAPFHSAYAVSGNQFGFYLLTSPYVLAPQYHDAFYNSGISNIIPSLSNLQCSAGCFECCSSNY